VPPSDQLKQLVELHKVAEEAMKGLIVRLWPGEAMPGSYFGLVWRLVDACPWVEVVKCSACIEGARRALAGAGWMRRGFLLTRRQRARSIVRPRCTIRLS